MLSTEWRAPRADLALAVLVIAVIAMMVVPLPTPLIDLLIALNLTLGVLLLAAALYVRDALGFAAFPTLLLLSTLYRLALNVSSTRLILLQADAGRVIEAFGSFVVRGDYRVGALVFAMLTLIQFIVIARGAERVAEVSARFSLDALPGKQLAIEAELRAGALRPERARTLRARLERESQLFGALDGALKFVKGDAIAGIVITLVNFVGGVSIGVFARDLPLRDSLTTYGLLTIGDGLVTQIPALLGATAAGIVVTRVSPDAEDGSLARDIASQLFHEPRALAVSAFVLAGMAAVPALPSWPFLSLALLCALGTFVRGRAAIANARPRSSLRLELSPQLAHELRGRHMRTLGLSLARERTTLASTLGVTLPEPEIRREDALSRRSFRWLVRELPLGPAHDAGDTPLRSIVATFSTLARAQPADWLDLDSVQRMIDALEREQPALVRLTMPRPVSPILLAEVLRALVREGVSVRWLGEIVEAIAPYAHEAPASVLAEHARRALARRISHALAPHGRLHVLRLSPEVEETLADAVRPRGEDDVLALPLELAREIEAAIARAQRSAPVPHALLTQAELRRPVRAWLADALPDLAVVSAHELTPELELTLGEPVGP